MLIFFHMETQEELRRNIANNIATLRKSKGFTQSELAEKLNYSDKSVSKWERGDSIPDALTLRELANFFGILVDDFYREKPLFLKKRSTIIRKKKFIIPFLAILIAWLVATLLFSIGVMADLLKYQWLLFIYCIPVTGILFTIFMAIYHDKFLTLVGESIIIWGAALSAFLTVGLTVGWENTFLVFVICAPLQLLGIFYYILKRDKSLFRKLFRKKKKNKDQSQESEEEK